MINALSSMFSPSSPQAEAIVALWWVMVGVFGAVFVITMALLAIALVRGRPADGPPRPPLGDKWFVMVSGLFIPGLILFALIIYTMKLTVDLRPPDQALTIRVTGYMWWWDVEYPESGVRIANEIYIPVGEPVRIELRTADVIHSLWVPSLSGKTDLIPEATNVQWFEASRPGKYWGQCAEFCGLQHARMQIYVVALPKEEFESWVAARSGPADRVPTDLRLLRGWKMFMTEGCAECHAIGGTPATGRIGPDLTHVGSRLTLGAGVVPNSFGAMAGWVSNPQALKPGNKMPQSTLDPDELHALTEYLMSLK